MGDRYDQLRLNHIDIGCSEMSEECFKILSDQLISFSIKTINTVNCMDSTESG